MTRRVVTLSCVGLAATLSSFGCASASSSMRALELSPDAFMTALATGAATVTPAVSRAKRSGDGHDAAEAQADVAPTFDPDDGALTPVSSSAYLVSSESDPAGAAVVAQTGQAAVLAVSAAEREGALGQVDARAGALLALAAGPSASSLGQGNPLALTSFNGAAHPMLPGVAAVAGMMERKSRGFAPVDMGRRDDLGAGLANAYTLSAIGSDGFSLSVTPRARLASDDLSQTAGVGGVLRFGDGLSVPRTGVDAQGWHMFIGADAQAVTWKLDRDPLARGGAVRVEDKELVGDAQAGFAIKTGGGDLALGLVHREIKSNGVSADEQFGGVTYKVKR